MKLLNARKILNVNIKNIIFDWGGVITDIDYQATIDRFAEIGMPNFREYYSSAVVNDVFRQFEKGEISADKMRNTLRSDYQVHVTDKEIDHAWCAMLKDTPLEKLHFLDSLQENYRLFLLSNTNEIHVIYYNHLLFKKYDLHFTDFFEKVFYSHQVGMRKPDSEIFEYVIDSLKIKEEETLFIDDLEMNILAAKEAGLQVIHADTTDIINQITKFLHTV